MAEARRESARLPQARPRERTLVMNVTVSSPVDLVVHIGTGKAGSSSIQSFLAANREKLRERGVLYPRTPGWTRHLRLGLYTLPPSELELTPAWHRQKFSKPERFRTNFRRRLFAEIDDAGLPRVLLSDEILFGAPVEGLRRLRRITDRMGRSLRLVLYLRRQDDHMVSRYQQGIKIGWIDRLAEWAQQDMSDLYDYHARICTWRQVLEPTEFVVRRFEAEHFVGGSLHQDFLHAAGIDTPAEDLEPVSTRNESLDAESVEFLRLLNLYRVENEQATPGIMDNRSLVKTLAEHSTGPVLTMPASALDEFMNQWEASNRRVSRDVYGDPDGQLFRAPRKTQNTTTSQLLDPSRLEHFLELSELPEPIHLPLRRIAEREAGIG